MQNLLLGVLQLSSKSQICAEVPLWTFRKSTKSITLNAQAAFNVLSMSLIHISNRFIFWTFTHGQLCRDMPLLCTAMHWQWDDLMHILTFRPQRCRLFLINLTRKFCTNLRKIFILKFFKKLWIWSEIEIKSLKITLVECLDHQVKRWRLSGGGGGVTSDTATVTHPKI